MKKTSVRIAVTLGFLALLLPLIPLMLQSVSAGWSWPQVWPTQYSWRSWNYVFSGSARTGEAIANTLLIAFAVTLLNVMVSIPAADALARWPMKFKWVVEALLFAPLVVPAFVPMMGIHLTFIQLGLTDSVIGVILVHVIPTLPYVLRALMISYQTLGFEWEDQARMLGARRLQRFYYVVLPHLLPGIAAGAGLSLLVSASQYLITLLVGGGQVLTLPLLMFPFMSGGDPAIGSAYAFLFAGVALVALLIMDTLLKGYYAKRRIGT